MSAYVSISHEITDTDIDPAATLTVGQTEDGGISLRAMGKAEEFYGQLDLTMSREVAVAVGKALLALAGAKP